MKKLLVLFGLLVVTGVVYAQQSGSLVWNPNGATTTINAPATGTFTYTLPTKTGTFALVSDVPTTTPVPVPTPPHYFGFVTLVNGTGTVSFPTSVNGCRVSDRSGNSVKYGPTGNPAVWQFSGVGPTVDYECR